jgi:hypothetical protein
MVLIQQKGDSIPGSGWNHEIRTKRRVKTNGEGSQHL